MPEPDSQYFTVLEFNNEKWKSKKSLRYIYREFYNQINDNLSRRSDGNIVELGSGIGKIKEIIPDCICTDRISTPFVERAENAYNLSFPDKSISNLILFDVFHHLEYPGTALKEFYRALSDSGRVLIFEPYISVLGYIVYGLLHHEPIGKKENIHWSAPAGFVPDIIESYAAQGNATWIFNGNEYRNLLADWKLIKYKRISSISYIGTGGYTKPQFYPHFILPVMQMIDLVCDYLPALFATRLLVVLEKP